MNNTPDLSDITIMIFVGMVFITGVVVVFKFMRGGKR
jgi:hypothetical protein